MLSHRKFVEYLLVGLVLSRQAETNNTQASVRRTLTVTVHQSSGFDNISLAHLQRMLAGSLLHWPDSSRVILAEQAEESYTQQLTLQMVLKLTPAVYKRQLLELQFQGKELPTIKVLNSDENAVKFVGNVPGALAVVDASAISHPAFSRVKVLKLDGLLPGQKGYRLQ